MTRFAFCNHWYPEAWDAWKRQGGPQLHGTADYWDVALRSAGHESETFILNNYGAEPEFGMTTRCGDMLQAVSDYKPDVICSMEVGRFGAAKLRPWFPNHRLVAFCSHSASDADLHGFDVIFSSFKWMPDYCRSIGVRCEYLPLAFGRPVLDRIGPLPTERDIPVCFIGGLGNRIWDQGTRTMAEIAEAVPEFQWWGYVAGSLSDLPVALQKSYRGQLWGIDYYKMLARTQICLNRHGEIAAKGVSLLGQNCRQYESVGLGCLLLTDDAGELIGHGIEDGLTFCATYSDAADAIKQIKYYEHGHIGGASPKRAQEFVLRDHTFESRVPAFIRVVESL